MKILEGDPEKGDKPVISAWIEQVSDLKDISDANVPTLEPKDIERLCDAAIALLKSSEAVAKNEAEFKKLGERAGKVCDTILKSIDKNDKNEAKVAEFKKTSAFLRSTVSALTNTAGKLITLYPNLVVSSANAAVGYAANSLKQYETA